MDGVACCPTWGPQGGRGPGWTPSIAMCTQPPSMIITYGNAALGHVLFLDRLKFIQASFLSWLLGITYGVMQKWHDSHISLLLCILVYSLGIPCVPEHPGQQCLNAVCWPGVPGRNRHCRTVNSTPRPKDSLASEVCHLVAVCGTNILVPCHVIKYLQLIWRSGTRRWNLRVPDLQMSCSNLT